MVICAVSDKAVGCDIEQVSVAPEKVAERFFSEAEQRYLSQYSGEEKNKEFYRLWTMKESYLKYLGTGINRPLNSFSALGDRLGVTLSSEYLPDACLTLCASDDVMNCRMLTPGQLLAV